MNTKKKLPRNRGAIILAVAATGLVGRTGFGASNAVTYSTAGATQSFNFATLTTNSGVGDPPVATTAGTGTYANPADLSTAFEVDNSSYSEPGLTGWYYAAQATPKVAVGSATTTTGGLFLSGSGSTTSLGAISTNSTGTEYFGVELENTSGSPLNTLDINFNDVLFWQNSGAKPLDFGYSVNAGAITSASDILPTSSLTLDSALASSFGTGSPASTYQTQAQSATLTLGSSIPNDGSIWLVWYTSTSVGTAQGVGMNGLSLSLSEANTSGGGAVTWATSSGAWDITSHNWTGASTVYADSDTVTFANSLTSSSTVTIQAGGVSPGSVTVNNTKGFSYTFTGGPIKGNGAFTNTAGTTYLATANSYSGGTNVNGGTLVADGDSVLGYYNGGVNIAGGGTLEAGAPIGTSSSTSQRALTVDTGGGTFNTDGFTNYFTGLASINDVLTVAGSGTLEIDGPMSFSTVGPSALNINSGATFVTGATTTITQVNNSTYNGNFVVAGTPKLAFGGGATYSGTGGIDITNPGTIGQVTNIGTSTITYTSYTTGAAITNSSGQNATINVASIVLNSNNLPFTPADVTNPDNLLSPTQNFAVTIGATKNGTLTIDSPISGSSDLNVSNDITGGGAGVTVLSATNTYTGTTLINTSGTLQLAVNGAIPSTSNVIFGTIGKAESTNTTLDLDGTVQTFASLSSGEFSSQTEELITNNSFSLSTLTIGGGASPANKYKGIISDGIGGVVIDISGPNTIGFSGNNTYSYGTILSGGTLLSSNDDNLGNAVVGTLTFNGGTLGVTGSAMSPYLTSRPITVASNGGAIDVASTTSYTLSNSPAISWGGTLNFTDTGPAAISQSGGTISVSPGAAPGVAAGASLTVTGTTDPFTDSSNSSSHVAVVNNGNLTVSQVNSSIASVNGTGTLTVGDGVNSNTLQIAQSSSSAGNTVGSLSILGNSTLDITNNTLIIAYGASDPINSIAALIASGYQHDAWTGDGITSTTAAANAGSYGIGYADGASGIVGGLSSGQIEITYTLLGDANLDHKVNGDDFTLMAANFNDLVTSGWDEGDFNYSGTVNGDDFVLLANNFNQFASQSAVSAADLSALESFAVANGISLTSVPEPASISLLAVGAVGLLRRRRRNV